MTDRLQSVGENIYFQAYLSADGKTPATGKTIAIQLSKNGGAYGNPSVGSASLTEIGNGLYYFAASGTDLNALGPLAWLGTCTGVDNVVAIDKVVKATNRGMSALPDAAVNTVGGLAGQVLAAGTATAGSASSLTLQTALSNANLARRAYLRIIGGAGAGQTANIASHTTTVLTFDRAMAVALDSTSGYIIVYGNAPATTSAGAVPPEWSQISNPSATVSLPNTTTGTVNSISAGAIDFAQFTSAFLAYCVRARLISTGVTTPISADAAWNVAGSWNNEPAYQNSAKTLWAWNNGAGWTISATLGTNGTSYWTTSVSVNGAYTAQGSAVGVPTVIARGNSVLSGFEPDQPGLANLTNLDTTVSSRLATASYVAAPTSVQNRQEMDTNSTRLANLDTTITSRLAASSYVIPPSTNAIAAATAAVMFVDGSTNALKVNADHSALTSGSVSTIANYITVPAAIAAASQSPSVITCLRGDTLRVALPALGDISTRSKLIFTAKSQNSDADDQAIVQVVEGIGLTRLNGAAVALTTATLSVTDAATGATNLEIDANMTAQFAVMDLVWDAQVFLTTGISSPIGGTFSVVADVTRAVT